MKLDSQLNVQLVHSQELPTKEHRFFVEKNHPQALYHSYLQLYESNQVQSREFQKIDEEQTDNQSKNELHLSKHAKEYITQLDILQQQNKSLKKQLLQVYAMVGCLKNQLNRCKQELDRMSRINQDNEFRISSKHQYILQELQALLQNKSLLDEEVEYLKSYMKNDRQPLQLKSHYLKTQLTQQSSQVKSEIVKQNNMKNSNERRQQQFIKSIQRMHQSITGKIQTNLVVIWRWLKQITHSYSKFTNWKRNNYQKITTPSLQPLLAISLLSQLKFIN